MVRCARQLLGASQVAGSNPAPAINGVCDGWEAVIAFVGGASSDVRVTSALGAPLRRLGDEPRLDGLLEGMLERKRAPLCLGGRSRLRSQGGPCAAEVLLEKLHPGGDVPLEAAPLPFGYRRAKDPERALVVAAARDGDGKALHLGRAFPSVAVFPGEHGGTRVALLRALKVAAHERAA